MKDCPTLLRLTASEAFVLFEFLDRHHRDGEVEVNHASESRVLRLLHGQLNGYLPDPFESEYKALLSKARQEVWHYDENLRSSLGAQPTA